MTIKKILPPAFNLAKKLMAINNSVYDATISLSGKLSTVQKLYLLAIVVLIFSDSLVFVALLTVLGLTAEFWPLFNRVWHSLAGKAILLLFYAIIANFALAGSASVVNEVVGVSSSHFNYTHNFAILLFLPSWALAMSIIALLLLQIIAPIYFFLLLIARPFGIKGFRITSHQHFQKWTMFIRLILSSILIFNLSLLSNVDSVIEDNFYSSSFFLTNEQPIITPPTLTNNNPTIEDTIVKILTTENKDNVEGLSLITGNKAIKPTIQSANNLDMTTNTDDEKISEREKNIKNEVNNSVKIKTFYSQKIRDLIAHFAYQLEANEKSRCLITNNAHVVELNDYEILQITPDSTMPHGYKFEVKACISPAFPAKTE
ncbi:hypothetical protein CXF83_12540 [Shewanella sp. Choline-02u-19]|uniref:hypothetical protein n=1 Tax=unclassified Shewanella TaxID=196818 RepID=UPI000C340B20|nr:MULTISPECIES: hypothetical protein [unclassified Shewanella]PKG75330.1 hypothetical protein CXF86_08120 [Shewanella sp. GutCb]PKH57975.1 hypothetical protein CXF84_06730 [Shewanella sp. Bg11-22]PKI27476.1 hypothetical protein CXF83_12540 [Shewanella sp. Choline-02u-19]